MSNYQTPTPGAVRQRLFRRRQSLSITVYPVEIDDESIGGLIDTKRLTAHEATDKQKVAAAIAELVRSLAKAKKEETGSVP